MVTEKVKKRSRIYYLKNREKFLERERLWRKNNSEKKRETDKKYRDLHKEEASRYNKEYVKNNYEKLRKQKAGYREENKDRINTQKRDMWKQTHESYIPFYERLGITKVEYRKKKAHENYEKNKDHVREWGKAYRDRNKKKIKERTKLYRKNNSEQRLKSAIKYHAKYGQSFNLKAYPYKWALQAWTNSIMKRDKKNCQICQQEAKESHHILHKQFYPELSLLINNGMSLCKKCHYEVHGVFITRVGVKRFV